MYENGDHMAKHYAAQATIAGQTSSYAGVGSNQVERSIISDEIFRRLADRGGSIGHFLMRLENAADRLVGTRPSPLKPENPTPPQPSNPTLVAKLSLIERSVDEIEMRLRDAVERLESFV